MKLFDAIKRDVVLSLKTVRFEFPRFLSFFVVLFMLQALFCSIFNLYANNDRTQLAYLQDQYRTGSGSIYHLKLLGCNADQRALLHNLDAEQDDDDEIFELLGADITSVDGTTQRRYDLYIQFKGNVENSYQLFRARYQTAISESGNWVEAQTLLLSYEIERAVNQAILIMQLVMVVGFGALAVWVLHTIMTNHYKFTYGIYLSFGANFIRLFRTAIWEMIWAALFTWLPAVVVANLLCWAIFSQTGLAYHVNIPSLIVTLFISLFTVGISVFASLKMVSRKPPVKLLIADDNSNLIHSPRRSKQLFGMTFPKDLGWLFFGRFWKYTLRLLAMTLSFAMIFVAGITLADCYDRMLTRPQPLYQVNFDIPDAWIEYDPSQDKDDSDTPSTNEEGSEPPSSEEELLGTTESELNTTDEEAEEETAPPIDYASMGYTDEIAKVFAEFPHMGVIYKESYYPARSIRSHVLLSEKRVSLGAGGISVSDKRTADKNRAMMNVNYQAMDEEVIKAFEFLDYGIEGDLSSVLTEKNTIAVTDGFLGATQFKWKVGDSIRIGLPTAETLKKILSEEADMMFVTDQTQLLRFYYNAGAYEYHTFTIGAIISDFPTDENWSIFFSPAAYETITGYPPIYESLEVYAKKGATEAEEKELYEHLRKAEFLYTNMSVLDLNTRDARQIEENKNYSGIFTMFASVLLAISPMIWVFSQILFYYKRRQEFDLYLSIGSTMNAIRKLMLQDALRYASISAGLFLLIAPPVSLLVHRVIGYITAFIGGDMLAAFKLPWIAYLIGALISALCGFISTMIPWFTYQKQESPLHQCGDEHSQQEETVHE